MPKITRIAILLGVLAGVFAGALLAFPPVRESLAWRLDSLRVAIRYALFPPEEAVFIPQADVSAAVQATLQAMTPSPTPTLTPTATETPPPDLPTATPEPTPTPIPESVSLTGHTYFDQHGLWNYCAPANLAMGLSYWGWQGDRLDTGRWLKPFDEDKNVMMYEMEAYVLEETSLSAVVRPAGTIELLKRFIAAGLPVLVEKGPFIRDVYGKVTWMGHYALVTGYDDAKREFITQDSYFTPDYPVSYDDLERDWRSFNYLFMVIYPPERHDEVIRLLGELSDPPASYQLAARRAQEEIAALEGLEQFFATFNYGTSLVNLQDYAGAASAYDQAFVQMADLPAGERPWRILWYQTGPYFAYYFTGRYQDVIDLADNTINTVDKPYLEESFVWRARAKLAIGDPSAADDVRKALEYHPGFPPAVDLAQQLGVSLE